MITACLEHDLNKMGKQVALRKRQRKEEREMTTSVMTRVHPCAARFSRLALLLALLLVTAGCATTTAEYQEMPATPSPEAKVILRPGDEIELKFPYWNELNDTQIIRPDGMITLQLIDSVKAQGLTPEELDDKLTKLYVSKIKDPVVSVVVRTLVDQRIYVGGEVNKPGLLTLQGEVNALQAVINAGGFNELARTDQVIVIRKDEEGKAVPYKVDLSSPLYETDPKNMLLLQPNDVVYVPKTVIANMNKFVKQYISDLILFRGIGLGFTYELREDWTVD
jgi:polysaccharide biosynthesis/export protein